jgi:hypothetical protein
VDNILVAHGYPPLLRDPDAQPWVTRYLSPSWRKVNASYPPLRLTTVFF